MGCVNFPNIVAPYGGPHTHRLLNIHKNQPGVLAKLNSILASLNVSQQLLRTTQNVGILLVDIDRDSLEDAGKEITQLSASVKTRVLY